MLGTILTIVLATPPLGLAFLLWRRMSQSGNVSWRASLAVALAGALAGVVGAYVERVVLAWTDLSLDVARSGAGGALLATFLLAAPLEEGLKVLVIWPVHGTRGMTTPRLGLTFAACAGAGFGFGETLVAGWGQAPSWIFGARMLLGMPAHLFFAGMWGYALGSRRITRGRWFVIAWLGATLLHALYDHLVFGRGPGLMVLALPMAVSMLLVTWVALRDVAPSSAESRPSVLLASLPEPPSLGAMRRALQRSDRPLMLHWIAIGALVTLGVVIAALAAAVYLGHVVGIDFALADESDVRSSGPLVLLGTATLIGFPIAGYLVARASAAHSVLEPAMGAGLAIVAAVLLVSLAAPVAAVFGLAAAPLAFALACGGAWFGLVR